MYSYSYMLINFSLKCLSPILPFALCCSSGVCLQVFIFSTIFDIVKKKWIDRTGPKNAVATKGGLLPKGKKRPKGELVAGLPQGWTTGTCAGSSLTSPDAPRGKLNRQQELDKLSLTAASVLASYCLLQSGWAKTAESRRQLQLITLITVKQTGKLKNKRGGETGEQIQILIQRFQGNRHLEKRKLFSSQHHSLLSGFLFNFLSRSLSHCNMWDCGTRTSRRP